MRTNALRLLAFLRTLGLVSATSLMLTGCNFHLRGYDTPMTYAVGSTVLNIADDPTTHPLKLPLTKQLNSVGVKVIDNIGQQIDSMNQAYTATITVDNVRFKKYELVGVLTEVRLVLSADVTYQTLQDTSLHRQAKEHDNMPITVKNTIQVERSYQFNKASVSVEDQQGEQIRDWLYDSLAKRITDQYVAISLPKVDASQINTSNSAISQSTNMPIDSKLSDSPE